MLPLPSTIGTKSTCVPNFLNSIDVGAQALRHQDREFAADVEERRPAADRHQRRFGEHLRSGHSGAGPRGSRRTSCRRRSTPKRTVSPPCRRRRGSGGAADAASIRPLTLDTRKSAPLLTWTSPCPACAAWCARPPSPSRSADLLHAADGDVRNDLRVVILGHADDLADVVLPIDEAGEHDALRKRLDADRRVRELGSG